MGKNRLPANHECALPSRPTDLAMSCLLYANTSISIHELGL